MKLFNRKHSSLRILSAFLAVILVFGLMVFALPESTEAANKTLVTDAVIAARINELKEKLNGTYWNDTSNTDRTVCKKKSSDHSCSHCRNTNVIKSDWFIKEFKFEKLSTDQFPRTYTVDSYLYPAASSCAGFASFAHWYIFRTTDKASVTTKKMGSYKSTKSNWDDYAQCGDLIRWGSHSFIYISNDKNGIKVLDCNCKGTDFKGKTANNCMVQVHTLDYDFMSGKFTVSRESTRAGCKHKDGYQTEWDGSKYVATVCSHCGMTFKYKVDKNYAGEARTTEKASIFSEPYADSSVLSTFARNAHVEIVGRVSNAYGNIWYNVVYYMNGKAKKGYVHESKLTAFVCPN